ncbi:MAG TPA: carboxypeptidase-like regulatory domain-containing protein, partial [Flavobacterium sp.]|nr:carboxypeptidase-like regulatory domain-containing protein [Flavobacterium sp.]
MKNNKSTNMLFLGENFLRVSLILFLFICFQNLSAQTSMISGKVTDDTGFPLPGVNVLIKGTAKGVQTDFDGKFKIEATPQSILVISYIGMNDITIAVGDKKNLDVVLQPSSKELEEVVVVGYGTRKKSDLIASVTSVDPEKMTKVATSNVGEMLRGKAAGVTVTLNSGAPLGDSKIVLRGQNSLNGDKIAAYVIVDGVPAGAINDINPNDIESLEILKDAAALAIYGARGANGVILITTKRGKTGTPSISYTGWMGVQNYNRNFDIYNGDEFAQLKREAVRTNNGGVYLPDDQIF